MRIPKADDPFFVRNAGRMFMLLSGVDHHPPGCPINEALRTEIQQLYAEAYEDGIDIIAVSEGGPLASLPQPDDGVLAELDTWLASGTGWHASIERPTVQRARDEIAHLTTALKEQEQLASTYAKQLIKVGALRTTKSRRCVIVGRLAQSPVVEVRG